MMHLPQIPPDPMVPANIRNGHGSVGGVEQGNLIKSEWAA